MAAALVRDPVYLQLNKALRDQIRSGEIPLGERFWTERDISLRFGVSRATANKALSNLVAEGILEYRKGVGTFVRGRPLDYDLQSLVSFTGKALAAGKKPTTQLLRFETLAVRQADQAVLERLQSPAEENVYYMERLRLADDLPVIFERRYVLARFCPDLSQDELVGSLYDAWTGKYGLEIIGGADDPGGQPTRRGRQTPPCYRRRGRLPGDLDRLSPPPSTTLVGENSIPRRRLRVSQLSWTRSNGWSGQRSVPHDADESRGLICCALVLPCCSACCSPSAN